MSLLETPVPAPWTPTWILVMVVGLLLLYDLFTWKLGFWENALRSNEEKDTE